MKFTKMQGIGNDYVYIYSENDNMQNVNELALKVSNRHFGIGSDGLILISKSDVADFKMRMFNSDGTEGEMCGNGIRCVGKFVYDKGLTDKTIVTIETLGGIKTLELNINNGKVETAKVDMGEPILEPEKIPMKAEGNTNKFNLKVYDKEFEIIGVSMGNPHAVTFVKDLDNFDVEKYGKVIECTPEFPNKTNVEFVEIIDRNYVKMRVWERGSGETLACGTGSSATAVTCILEGLTDRKVDVKLLGGNLKIEWNEEDNHVYMTGPAVTVFEGELFV